MATVSVRYIVDAVAAADPVELFQPTIAEAKLGAD